MHKSTVLQYYALIIIWNVLYIHKNIILTRVSRIFKLDEDIVRTTHITKESVEPGD